MAKFTTFCGWLDVPHISPEAQAELATAYLPHELEARTKGVPSLGAGAIYPVSESDIVVEPFVLPAWYKHSYAMDVGWNRTAVIWGALDIETDVLYLYSEHYRGQAEPAVHAQGVKARGEWIPGVIDPAARGRGQKDGEALLDIYKDLGLKLLVANNAVESGIFEVWQRLSTGRLKIFRTLANFLTEFRIYRRDEKGKIVKESDHLMDAVRYLCMSGITLAATRPAAQWGNRPGGNPQAQNTFTADYDPYAELNQLPADYSRGHR